MTEALVALGGNMPVAGRAPASTLRRALNLLEAVPGIAVARVSRLYRTPAWPPGSGPDFVNAAAVLETELPPVGLLGALHAVEARLGRTRSARWEPRVCDLDLLGMEDAVMPDAETVKRWMALPPNAAASAAPEELILPHPRLHERAFVLVPLDEVAPAWRHPLLGRTAMELAAALPPGALGHVVPL